MNFNQFTDNQLKDFIYLYENQQSFQKLYTHQQYLNALNELWIRLQHKHHFTTLGKGLFSKIAYFNDNQDKTYKDYLSYVKIHNVIDELDGDVNEVE